jgi:hypothetical protein
MSLPSSSWRALKIAVVCWRLDEDVKLRFATSIVREVGLEVQPLRRMDDGIPGRRKSSTGSGVRCRYLRGLSWRNARAAQDEVEALSCKQFLVIHRVTMVVGKERHQGRRQAQKCVDIDITIPTMDDSAIFA